MLTSVQQYAAERLYGAYTAGRGLYLKELMATCVPLPVALSLAKLRADCYGFVYKSHTGTGEQYYEMVIRDSLTKYQKLFTIYHEIGHIVVDRFAGVGMREDSWEEAMVDAFAVAIALSRTGRLILDDHNFSSFFERAIRADQVNNCLSQQYTAAALMIYEGLWDVQPTAVRSFPDDALIKLARWLSRSHGKLSRFEAANSVKAFGGWLFVP